MYSISSILCKVYGSSEHDMIQIMHLLGKQIGRIRFQSDSSNLNKENSVMLYRIVFSVLDYTAGRMNEFSQGLNSACIQ